MGRTQKYFHVVPELPWKEPHMDSEVSSSRLVTIVTLALFLLAACAVCGLGGLLQGVIG